MPYINPSVRTTLNDLVEEFNHYPIRNAGELNYLVTQLVHSFLNQHKEGYQNYNDALGALTGAQMELYRRYVVPYEDQKIKENGDVPDYKSVKEEKSKFGHPENFVGKHVSWEKKSGKIGASMSQTTGFGVLARLNRLQSMLITGDGGLATSAVQSYIVLSDSTLEVATNNSVYLLTLV